MDVKNRKTYVTKIFRKIKQFVTYFNKLTIGKVINMIISYIILVLAVIILGFGIYFVGIPGFGQLFQSLSPWNQQQQDISNKNNVRDAYSAIVGSDVGLVSQNGIIKWFSSKEAKEIDISIPKLINYSPIFNDDSYRNELKEAFKDSINDDVMGQSSTTYKVFYDGKTLISVKDGEEVSSYRNLEEKDRKKIQKKLEKELYNEKDIKFKEWQKLVKQKNVDYDFEPKSNIVNVKGVFISDGKLWFTTQYKISVQYKYDNTNDDWEIVQKTLKVVKKK